MRWRWFLPIVSLVLGAAPTAQATPSPKSVGIIDRIMAIVGYECILLSELKTRARPIVKQLDSTGPASGPARTAAEMQIYRDMLERMIDEKLVASEALRNKLVVTPAEVDAAIQSVATSQGLTPAKLIDAAKAAGLTEAEYRDELRRQLLDGKVTQLKVVPRIKGYSLLGEAQRAKRLDEEHRKYLQELRAASYVEVRL